MIELSAIAREKEITKEKFLGVYKAKEIPVVMENITKDWPAKAKWSLEYFESLAGDKEVKLYDSKPSYGKKLQHAAETSMPIKEYFKRLRNGENDLRMFFFNMFVELPILKNDFTFPDHIGLKFFKKLPVMFVGGNGAKVQMHIDIDYADIFLCHFGGKKRVVLFSPEQTPLMYHVPYSFSSLFDVDWDNPDYEKYPALKHLKGVVTELNHGDVLYIPPGWWHYIVYEEIGISMAIRQFPRSLGNIYKMLRNLLWTRSVEGIMRLVIGQKWNERNEKLSVTRTHQYLKENNLK
jgi:hypothetical protein